LYRTESGMLAVCYLEPVCVLSGKNASKLGGYTGF
jgi:hypothetical protein